MSGNNHKKSVRICQDQKKVSSSKGLRNIFNAIGRRIFSKVYKNEVEYGQTLSKKRRKNCVLKSVSLLRCPEDENGFLIHSPYHINFEFSRDEPHFRGSVMNFQKIDVGESCCEKCLCALRKGESLSKFSISSDSACDVSSESSCDDADCKYRKSKAKKKSKSSGDVSKGRTVENFIRIHKENFQNGVADSVCESNVADQNLQNSLQEWTNDEPPYESLVSRFEDFNPGIDESDYDILLTKPNYRVVEPSYENLKLIENFYEAPACKKLVPEQEENTKELEQPKKTYDEVIESLKLWHMSSKYPEDCEGCSCCGETMENEFNHRVEGYDSMENDFNNDIEEFCC